MGTRQSTTEKPGRRLAMALVVSVVAAVIPLAGPAAAFDDPVPINLATGGAAFQSTTLNAGTGAGKAVDRFVSGFVAQNSMARTGSGSDQYWQVDIGAARSIGQIKLWEGIDTISMDDLHDFSVFVSTSPFQSASLTATRNQSGVSEYRHSGHVQQSRVFNIGRSGRYVRVQREGDGILSLAEVEILAAGQQFNEIAPRAAPTWGAKGLAGSIALDIESEIFAIEQIGRTLFVGGRFTQAIQRKNGPTVNQPYLMALDAQTGELLTWFRPVLNGAVLALEASPDGSRLFVGGEFYSVDDHAASAGLVALDPRTGDVDPSWTTHMERRFATAPPSVKNLEIDEVNQHLYAIGSFNAVRNSAGTRQSGLGNVARFSLSTGAVDAGWRPQLTNGSGYGVAVDRTRNRVYLSGTFASVNGGTTYGNFVTVKRDTGAIEPGAPTYPFNSGFRETFDVVATQNLVFVGGSQHILGVIDPDSSGATYDLVNRIYTNGGGGDVQDIEVVGDRVYASCHCRAFIHDEDLPGGSRIPEGDVHGLFAVDAVTGAFQDTFPTGLLEQELSAGPWAIHGGTDRCLWVGGDMKPVAGKSYPQALARFCPESGPSSTGLAAPSPRATDATAPSPPGRPVASRNGNDITLSWSGSTDARGIASYGVYRDGTLVTKTRPRSVILRDEPPGAHTYAVAAIDPAGNRSAFSATAAATVPKKSGDFIRYVKTSLDSWLAGRETGPFTFVRDLESGRFTGGGGIPAARFFGGYSPGGMPDDDGGLVVKIGGEVPSGGHAYLDQAAGYRTTVDLSQATPVSIEFDYRLSVGESVDDVSPVLWVDGVPRSPSGAGYLETRQDGYQGPWTQIAFDLGTLAAGSHSFTIGLRVDVQSRRLNSRNSIVAFDDVVIADARPGAAFVGLTEGAKIRGTQPIRIAATDHLTTSGSLAVQLSVNGGQSWLPTTYGGSTHDRSVNTTSLPDGNLELVARVTDGQGRRTDRRLTVEVDNETSVGELAAQQGATVVWRFDEVSSNIAADLVGAIDGTYVGNPQRGVTSPVAGSGRAVRFDGVDDGVRLPPSPLIDGRISSESTVELWFSADNVSKRSVLYEQGGTTRGMSLYLDGGRLYAGAWNTAADAGLDVPWTSGPAFVSKAVGTGGLHHVALVHDVSLGRVTAYLDGQRIGLIEGIGRIFPDTGLGAIGHARGGTRFHDGASSTAAQAFFDGLIDEVILFDQALSHSALRQHEQAGR